MEAIIFSLLLFFSNADYSFANIQALAPYPAPSSSTGVSDSATDAYVDDASIESSSKGKVVTVDLEGL